MHETIRVSFHNWHKNSNPVESRHYIVHACILISKEAVDKLNLKAQDPDCQMVEVVRPPDTLIFKVAHLEAYDRRAGKEIDGMHAPAFSTRPSQKNQ